METTVQLNDAGNLFGVLNLPSDAEHPSTAMIFINAGFLHHIGPYGLYTDLARLLADKGICSLRFDLAGLGDSLATQSPKSSAEKSSVVDDGPVSDIRSAMDYLEQHHQVTNFVVCGLCSGADDSLEVALADDRVCGTLLIDGPGFRTGKFNLYHYLLHYPRRLLSAKKWKVLVSRLRKSGKGDPELDLNDDIRRDILEDELREMTRTLVLRNTSMLFLYTGGVSDYYNHRAQFQSMFPEYEHSDLVESVYMPNSDHLFMLNEHRNELKVQVVAWVNAIVHRDKQKQKAA